MAHIICCACHRHVEIKPLKRKAKLRCSSCGSRAVRVLRLPPKVWMLNGGVTEPEKARIMTYAALQSIRDARGYRGGWVGMKFKAIFGAWPAAEEMASGIGRPSSELLWWIRQEAKAYAKERKATEAPAPIVMPTSPLMTADDWATGL